MRIAVLNLTYRSLSAGYMKYLQHIVPRLRVDPSVSDLLVYVPPGHERLPGLGANARSWRRGDPFVGYHAVAAAVRAWKPDVVFIPTARFVECGAPTVCMVHNMLPMRPPPLREGARSWGKARLDALLARRAVHKADRVIAVSEFVREHLVRAWRVPESNVRVVCHGVDAESSPQHAVTHDLPSDFVFAAGSLFPYRGYEDVIRALALTSSPSLHLVIAGDGSTRYRQSLQHLCRELGVTERVRWMGHVDADTMSRAYRLCRAFVMTSRVEACPNIALEAMAHGSLCISTRCAPMPEFFGDSAMYYNAGDAQGLSQHIESLRAPESAQQHALRAQAVERAARFTWSKTFEGLMHELRSVATQRNAVAL
ncbi:MAG: glycosyltransferase family 4 protein [Gemmatimonas sp.]